MNEHIELVKQWIADPQSVTEAELGANANDARDAADAAAWDDAANAAAHHADLAATRWVKHYEDLTK